MSDPVSSTRSSSSIAPIPDGFERLEWVSGFSSQMSPMYQKVAEDGTLRRGFRVEEQHLNGNGTCHGGMLMAFADICFGMEMVHTYDKWVTVRLMTDFLSSPRLGDWVEGDGVITSAVDGFVTTKGRIFTPERTVMTGSAVYKGLTERTVVA